MKLWNYTQQQLHHLNKMKNDTEAKTNVSFQISVLSAQLRVELSFRTQYFLDETHYINRRFSPFINHALEDHNLYERSRQLPSKGNRKMGNFGQDQYSKPLIHQNHQKSSVANKTFLKSSPKF